MVGILSDEQKTFYDQNHDGYPVIKELMSSTDLIISRTAIVIMFKYRAGGYVAIVIVNVRMIIATCAFW